MMDGPLRLGLLLLLGAANSGGFHQLAPRGGVPSVDSQCWSGSLDRPIRSFIVEAQSIRTVRCCGMGLGETGGSGPERIRRSGIVSVLHQGQVLSVTLGGQRLALRGCGAAGLRLRAEAPKAEGAQSEGACETGDSIVTASEDDGAAAAAEEEQEGDPAELAVWLVDKVLSTKGSKKELNIVQAELCSLELRTEDAVACLKEITQLDRSLAASTAMGFVLRVLGDLVDGRIPGSGTEYSGIPREISLTESCRREAAKLVVEAMDGKGWISGRWLHKLVRVMRLSLDDLRDAGLYSSMSISYVTQELDFGEDVVPPSLIKFLGLAKIYPVQEVVFRMIVNDQWGVAEEMIRVVSNQREDIEWFTEQAIMQEKYKIAQRMSLSFNLAESKSDSGRLLAQQAQTGYHRQGVQKLLNRQMYEGAITYIANHEDLEIQRDLAKFLFEELVLLEQFELASAIRCKFNIEDMVDAVGPALIEKAKEERRKREEGTFRVPSSCPIFIVDSLIGLQDAAVLLKEFLQKAEAQDSCHSFLMGLDTEWKPVRSTGEKVQTSILQIACHEDSGKEFVMIFDLQFMLSVALGDGEGQPNSEFSHLCELYISALAPICRSEKITKLGFQLSDDLKKLAKLHPDLNPAFAVVNHVIDLSSWQKAVQFPNTRNMWSLAKLVQNYLDGAILCKQQCMSDWSLRPLTKPQVNYASSDAYVLIPLYRVMSAQFTVPPPSKFCSNVRR